MGKPHRQELLLQVAAVVVALQELLLQVQEAAEVLLQVAALQELLLQVQEAAEVATFGQVAEVAEVPAPFAAVAVRDLRFALQ